MKIIPSNSGSADSIGGQTATGMQVHRRIEITVEREIVSVLVKSRPEAGTAQQACDGAGPQIEPAQLDHRPTGVSDKR
jgi:hypothetical protein